jgi:ABC-type transporter Mla subunit MlaD
MEALVAQAVGASMDEIDRLSAELDKVREVLRNEGERVGRLVTNYVGLSEATMAAMKIISDRLKAWKASSHQPE